MCKNDEALMFIWLKCYLLLLILVINMYTIEILIFYLLEYMK